MRPSVEWFRGLSEEEKESFTRVLLADRTVLGRLYKIIQEWDDELSRQETSIADYDTPSWSEKQAHRNGLRAGYRKLRDLLSFLHPRP